MEFLVVLTKADFKESAIAFSRPNISVESAGNLDTGDLKTKRALRTRQDDRLGKQPKILKNEIFEVKYKLN